MDIIKEKTGFPSIDKPWLKYYKDGAWEAANNIPVGKTVWDVMEAKLNEYIDYPAIEYFGKVISRKEFINLVYIWAKAFKALGVKEDEVVAYYGPFFPDVGAMAFALNLIGACPYFLKLAISPDALAEETKECKVAIVYDGMWQNVGYEFSKDRFEKVIIVKATDGMSGPKKQIVSLMSKLKSKTSNNIPTGEKYLFIKQAKALAKSYSGDLKAPFVPNRASFITSSSGTSLGSVVKGAVATNESVLAQLFSASNSEILYTAGSRVLNHFPPTAATSLNSLFLLVLFRGGTVIFDPRVSSEDFYNQLLKLKPEYCVNTSSAWELFFNRIETQMKNGARYDFSYALGWMMGGEGTSIKKANKWNSIMRDCNATALYTGYGQSEIFASLSVDNPHFLNPTSKQIAGVGLVESGHTAGVFDKNGNELPYNNRGELWIKSKAIMKCYYNKPELTAETIIDGWVHTGDLAEIDDNGFVFIWGRITDTVEDSQGNKLFLFDISNKLLEKDYINDAIVLRMPTDDDKVSLVAHIVWSDNPSEENQIRHIEELNTLMKEYLPSTFEMSAYSVHDVMLPYSPTTLKKDKNCMSKQTEGFIQVIKGQVKDIVFTPTDNGKLVLTVKE